MPEHTVRSGDCVYSLAARYGSTPDSIWSHPRNAELRSRGRDLALLYPGDVLYIPDAEERTAACATGQRHRFVRKLATSKLQLRLLRNGKPRAAQAYSLVVDGQHFSGQTDASGFVRHDIPPQAQSARLTLTDTGEVIPLAVGELDPVDEISGVQQRLANLGHYAAEITGELDEPTQLALASYQRQRGLEVTRDPDAATRDALVSDHKC